MRAAHIYKTKSNTYSKSPWITQSGFKHITSYHSTKLFHSQLFLTKKKKINAPWQQDTQTFAFTVVRLTQTHIHFINSILIKTSAIIYFQLHKMIAVTSTNMSHMLSEPQGSSIESLCHSNIIVVLSFYESRNFFFLFHFKIFCSSVCLFYSSCIGISTVVFLSSHCAPRRIVNRFSILCRSNVVTHTEC